jgi:hypothetical protein
MKENQKTKVPAVCTVVESVGNTLIVKRENIGIPITIHEFVNWWSYLISLKNSEQKNDYLEGLKHEPVNLTKDKNIVYLIDALNEYKPLLDLVLDGILFNSEHGNKIRFLDLDLSIMSLRNKWNEEIEPLIEMVSN